MSLEQQVASLVDASNKLTSEVEGKIVDIDKKVNTAIASFNKKIDETLKSIPELTVNIYVNNQTGSDDNTGLSKNSKLKTLDKALSIAKTRVDAIIHLSRVPDAQNNPYYVFNKHEFKANNLHILADVNDGYTENSHGQGLENEFDIVPKIIFSRNRNDDRNFIGSISCIDGRLTFGRYRLSVNLEWSVSEGIKVKSDGGYGIRIDALSSLRFDLGCKIFLNSDSSFLHYSKCGFIENSGIIYADLTQGVDDVSAAKDNYLIGYWNELINKQCPNSRLFINGFNGSKSLSDFILNYTDYVEVPSLQLAIR